MLSLPSTAAPIECFPRVRSPPASPSTPTRPPLSDPALQSMTALPSRSHEETQNSRQRPARAGSREAATQPRAKKGGGSEENRRLIESAAHSKGGKPDCSGCMGTTKGKRTRRGDGSPGTSTSPRDDRANDRPAWAVCPGRGLAAANIRGRLGQASQKQTAKYKGYGCVCALGVCTDRQPIDTRCSRS